MATKYFIYVLNRHLMRKIQWQGIILKTGETPMKNKYEVASHMDVTFQEGCQRYKIDDR